MILKACFKLVVLCKAGQWRSNFTRQPQFGPGSGGNLVVGGVSLQDLLDTQYIRSPFGQKRSASRHIVQLIGKHALMGKIIIWPIQSASQRYTARKQLIALIAASVFNKIVTHVDAQRKRFAPEPGFLKPRAETLISAARNLYAKRKLLAVAGGNRIPALSP